MHGKYKKLYRSNKLKVSAPTWNGKFESPERSYFVLDIQNYFEYLIKKHETLTNNLLIRIYINNIEIRIAFKMETAYYLEFLTT